MASFGISISVSLPNPKIFVTAVKQPVPICSFAPINSVSGSASVTAGSVHCSSSSRRSWKSWNSSIMGSAAETVEKQGIKIVRKPPESQLSELGVRSWPKWGCPPSKFPWTYSSKETCYLLEGKVKVYPDGSDEAVEIAAGDLVVFPSGMSCTWDVSEAVDKHYKFE